MKHTLTHLLRLFLALALFAPAQVAFAANQVVTDCGDTGSANQLRAKINASQSSGGGTITFTCGPATIVLNSVLPTINTAQTMIDGGGNITLSGNNASRIFFIDTGGNLYLQNITLTNGYDPGGGGAIYIYNSILNATNVTLKNNLAGIDGGALYGYVAVVVLVNVTFDTNHANDDGGGAYCAQSTFTLSNVNFTNNSAADYSGALSNDTGVVDWSGGSMSNNQARIAGAMDTYNNTTNPNVGKSTLRYVTISDNTATDDNSATTGGGLLVFANANLILTESRLSDNKTAGVYQGNPTNNKGGGVFNAGTMTLTNVSVNSNRAALGGGIWNDTGGTATLTKVTLSNNSATYGGGMVNFSGAATLTNVTLSGNGPTSAGGGIYNFGGTSTLTNATLSGNSSGIDNANGGTVTLKNTLIAHGTNGANCSGFGGGAFCLSDDNTCGFGAGRDGVNNLLLGPLANNGGLTQTHLPGAGSAAIDNATGSGAPARDQRDYIRSGAAPDVGAVEVGGTLLPAPTTIVSKKTHGAMDFGITLPLTGNGAVECRSGGVTGDHQIVMNFAAPVTVTGANVTKGIGNVSGYTVNGSQVTVNLTGIANGQNIFTTLFGVSDGTNSNDVSVPMGVLFGDTSGNGTVNSSDVSQTKGQSGLAAGAGNFRTDVNLSGAINSSDVSAVKSKSGTALP